MNWAVVIGIDRYWSDQASLRGAVNDALEMRTWLLDKAGGNVPEQQLLLLLSPREGDDPGVASIEATKDNLILAINDLMLLSKGEGDRLYFFFAGHGLTARVANRDENALVTTGFNAVNTDHSIALRSLWEFFETTQFRDQFFFVDACRNVPPWDAHEFEVGRWTLPRSRDPGKPPVQQFILYATSPGLKAVENREVAGEEHGAFTKSLLSGLGGDAAAKAWSWERECYEVRWERLATYVKQRVEQEKLAAGASADLLQVPQDAGSRGVPGRDRDAVVVSLPSAKFANERLEVQLEPDTAYPKAGVVVLDAIGATVAEAVRLTGSLVTFELPPRTYALRAVAPDFKEGLLRAPIELYGAVERQTISLHPLEEETKAAPPVVEPKPDPRIVVEAPDPLTVIEVRDETGNVKAVWRAASELPAVTPGFYRVRLVGPEASSEEQFVTLAPGEEEAVELSAAPAGVFVAELATAIGATTGPGETLVVEGLDPIAWPEPSTLVSLAVGAAIDADSSPAALGALGVALPPEFLDGQATSGVAVYAVASGSGEGAETLKDVRLRLWPAGEAVPADDLAVPLDDLRPGLAGHVVEATPGAYWLSIERGEETPPVLSLTVLNGRLATVVAQHEPEGLRLYQYHPELRSRPTSAATALRRLEYLERSLLGGRLDSAKELAAEIATTAGDDPFAGCLCGYALLRLGMLEELNEAIGKVIAAAPGLSDVYVLRGEYEAATGGKAGRQSFADATATGIPVFAEGLTRLVEGLRAHDFHHPRGAIVRHLFQRHVRGSMWSVFTPRRFEPGTLIVTGADTGYEA
ncbi:MAG: caspase family protein [Gaiellaceae bacterium]